MNSIEQYRDFFDRVADDLDPEHVFERPQLRDADWTCGNYSLNENVISIGVNRALEYGYTIEQVLAHELRHWWQNQVGWLRPDGPVLYWLGEDHTHDYYFTEHENRPWEIDAMWYERDACARLLGKKAA